MYEKMDNIDIYNNSAKILESKTPSAIISWITILVILLIMMMILFLIPFNIYKKYTAYVNIENDKTYLNLLLKESDFPFNKNDKLYIKNDSYKYEIVKISDGVVTLVVNLSENLRVDNNILSVNVLKERTTVFEIIEKVIKKGFGL